MLNKKKAKKILKHLQGNKLRKEEVVLRKIQYKGGICKQDEHLFLTGKIIEITLCKSFKILDEEV